MIDIKLTEDGDFELNSKGDLKTVQDLEERMCRANFRIKTMKGDWLPYPLEGSYLYKLIGDSNTEETGNTGSAYIENAIVDLFDNIEVYPIPLEDRILFYIDVEYNGEESQLEITQSLNGGV